MPHGWGWAGSVETYLSTPSEAVLASLAEHHSVLMVMPAADSQVAAWRAEELAVREALRECVRAEPEATKRWSVIFEYELPLEGGRRPDVVVLVGGTVVVLEFKSVALPLAADVDQVRAYAHDLGDYHAETHNRLTVPVLVLQSAAAGFAAQYERVTLTAPDGIAAYLLDAADDGTHDLEAWLDAPYRPLPSLVEAARRIFAHEPLPHVRHAQAVGIPETVALLGRLIEEAAERGERVLAFVTGVPGSGKTLVGLRLVYERAETAGRATFLSGNGPLVKVLQDALKSTAFVRDLHAFIRTYGMNAKKRVPDERVIVFDEAQRAWDEKYMQHQRGVARSEPQLLVEIGERLPSWVSLIGLVGEGQEIHSGEEAGIGQWRTAAAPPSAAQRWTVHCAPKLEEVFSGLDVVCHDELDLTVSLRTKRAEQLHDWVRHVLAGGVVMAARLAARIQSQGYPMYVTRDLEDAKDHVRARYVEEPGKTYGLLASSHDNVLKKFGVDNGFMATSRMNVARWYNGDRSEPTSAMALTQPVTEFGCQGLELDTPILCWGDDLRWNGEQWDVRPRNRRYRLDDPIQVLMNVYRVLLTRGREGLVTFVPPAKELDKTEHALLIAGFKPLPEPADLVGVASSIA